MIVLQYMLELPSEKKKWNNWKLTKYCWFSNILLKHCWFISVLLSYYTIFTSTRYFIRKPRVKCFHQQLASAACSASMPWAPELAATSSCCLAYRQRKRLRKAVIPSLGFQEACEHKCADLLAVVLDRQRTKVLVLLTRTCHFSIAESN